MDARLQLRVQRYGWDKAAPHYERSWARQLAPAQQCLLEMARLGSGERVLDMACGTGLVTFAAADSVGTTGSVTAGDISDAMVARVREDAAARGSGNVTAERMNAERLDFADESFDTVLCALGLMYAPDPIQCVREARRVLRVGGRFVAAVWGARDRCGWAEIFPIVDARVRSEVCPLFFQLGTGDALRTAFELANLSNIEIHRISTTLEYSSASDALDAAFLGGPVALAYSRFDEATRASVHAEYLASINAYGHDEGYRIPGEFVIGTGTH